MIYRYTKTSIILQGAVVAVFLIMALMSSDWYIRGISIVLGAVLFKDLIHCFGAEFSLDSTGLLEKSRFKSKYRMTWDNLEIISKTHVNRRWIMLRAKKKSYYMIKPYIENYEGLARDVIMYIKDNRIKGVYVHEDLIKRLRLNIKLNSDGLIKFD